MKALYVDDDLCKTFGFNYCVSKDEVSNLICIYSNLISKAQPAKIQELLESCQLSDFIELFIKKQTEQDKISHKICSCFPWFLDRRKSDFDIPNYSGGFLYQMFGTLKMETAFSTSGNDIAWDKLSQSERSVASLYAILLRDFNNIPDMKSSEWLRFGFCYCRSDAENAGLATAYLRLVKQSVSLYEIANAWENKTLGILLSNNEIDVSSFANGNFRPCKTPASDIGIYQLMLEVNHAISGQFCECYTPKLGGITKHETHLSKESEGDYGFLDTNSWERWRLFNFYQYVFTQPRFDPVEMQNAKRSADTDSLDRYLESLVPGFRHIMMDIY